MKQSLTIIFFLCLIYFPLAAQNDDEDPRIKDSIINDRHSAAAAANAARESGWSLSSNTFEWKKPVYNKQKGWHTESVNQKVNVNITIPSQRPTSSRGRSISEMNAQSRANQTNRTVYFQKKQLESRQRAQEERRRRIEAENQRDYAQGYHQHKAQTAGFYMNKAAEDAWLHTEGVRLLENINAVDKANIPDASIPTPLETKKGYQLASLLHEDSLPIEKNQHVQVIILDIPNEERKFNVDLNIHDTPYNLIDNGRVYELDEWSWETAFSKETIIPQSSLKNCFSVEEEILIDGKTLYLDSFYISTLPYNGCVAFFTDTILYINNAEPFPLPAEITQMVICGHRIIGKLRNTIVEISGNNATTLYSFETEQFDLSHDTDTTLLLLSNSWEVSVVARINIKKNSLDEIARTGYNIRKVVSSGNKILGLVDNCILNLNENIDLLYCNDEETINDICFCKEGLLVASDSHITILNNNFSSCQFLPSGASLLWFDQEHIYALNHNKDLVKYTIKK